MACPTIHCANCACVVLAASACATSLPPRSTAMQFDTRSTSPSLWLMNMGLVWATIVVAALAGTLIYALIAWAERVATFWHPSQR